MMFEKRDGEKRRGRRREGKIKQEMERMRCNGGRQKGKEIKWDTQSDR